MLVCVPNLSVEVVSCAAPLPSPLPVSQNQLHYGLAHMAACLCHHGVSDLTASVVVDGAAFGGHPGLHTILYVGNDVCGAIKMCQDTVLNMQETLKRLNMQEALKRTQVSTSLASSPSMGTPSNVSAPSFATGSTAEMGGDPPAPPAIPAWNVATGAEEDTCDSMSSWTLAGQSEGWASKTKPGAGAAGPGKLTSGSRAWVLVRSFNTTAPVLCYKLDTDLSHYSKGYGTDAMARAYHAGFPADETSLADAITNSADSRIYGDIERNAVGALQAYALPGPQVVEPSAKKQKVVKQPATKQCKAPKQSATKQSKAPKCNVSFKFIQEERGPPTDHLFNLLPVQCLTGTPGLCHSVGSINITQAARTPDGKLEVKLATVPRWPVPWFPAASSGEYIPAR